MELSSLYVESSGEPSVFLLPIFFATQIIGGAKELVALLLLSGDI